ncbi:hypothetical protein SPAB_02570 [Salmonella enterica subsp. enterica serovar Paratyphi B str. SPB7]|uniref:Uncharacterized protein n=1 Tax=Salmonella paratyphi B (strain ATCC BAA-1250 / SPB7) TaxID=1016998 RepID=A0A6C6Z2N1_SALPB|nr:hypothetical protein SPAB_02570 [Salmonella enterica subsp. enterica serovar Paratyphi B str. SPB7]
MRAWWKSNLLVIHQLNGRKKGRLNRPFIQPPFRA